MKKLGEIELLRTSTAVLVPFLFACGILYDVGYMFSFDDGMFGFFSTSEHILFAVQATPIISAALIVFGAILTTPLAIVAIASKKISDSISKFLRRAEKPKYGWQGLLAYFLFLAAIVLGIVLVGRLGTAPGYFLAALTFFFGSLFFVNINVFLKWPKQGRSHLILVASFGLLFSYGLGSLVGETRKKEAKKCSTDEMVLKTKATVTGTLIRGGDKGVIFADSFGSILFVAGNDIIKITHLPEQKAGSCPKKS